VKNTTQAIFDELFARYPALEACRADVSAAYEILCASFRAGGKLLVCGNGGSAADAEHIVGELMKSFKRRRPVPERIAAALEAQGPDGAALVAKLEGALPAVSLVSMSGVITAFANDVAWETAFAQQVLGLAREGDVLLAISTSGDSANCVAAVRVAHAAGARAVAFTGRRESRLSGLCDVTVRVPETETYKVQESHLPLYHALCAMLEAEIF
jgi:D-sedoheptulose 7-phosphate isomerase